jgi:hypothetical protein
VKTFNAHFDGRVIVLDEPAQLKPNAKVKVIAPDEDAADDSLASDCARLSEPAFRATWDNDADDVCNELATMANDPQIQRELRSINAEFAAAGSDGLGKHTGTA